MKYYIGQRWQDGKRTLGLYGLKGSSLWDMEGNLVLGKVWALDAVLALPAGGYIKLLQKSEFSDPTVWDPVEPYTQRAEHLAPRYKHGCDRCRYLGQWKHYDLYFCEQIVGGPTVICRFGDWPNAYASGLSFGLVGIHPYAAAVDEAISRGWYTPTEG